MTKDRIFGSSILLFCLVMYMETFNFAEKTKWQVAGPEAFPRAIIGFVAVTTVILLIQTFFQKTKSNSSSSFTWKEFLPNYGKIIIQFALFGIYVFLLPILSFIPATIIFLIVGQALLMGFKKPKEILLNLTISFITTFAIYLIFTYLLKIWLP